jgi:hypothetical protein
VNRHALPAFLAPFALLTCAGAWSLAVHAAPAPGDDADDEVELRLADAPAGVQGAVARLTAPANVKKVTKESDEGVDCFEIEYTDNAVECSALLSPAGELIELERATPAEKLPAAVLAALRKQYPGATFTDPHVVTRTVYEVDVVVDGKKHEVEADAAGNIDDDNAEDEDQQADDRKP